MDANRGQAVTFAESGLRAAERGEHARAVYELTRALELDSTLLPVRAGRGLALLALGKSGEAIADLEQAARASGDAGMWNNLGCCYAQAGRLGEAQQALAEAARRDPGLVAARTNLGDLFRAQGRIAEARTWYQAALRLDSADVGARDGLAALLGLAVEGQGEAAGGQTGGPPPAAPGAPTQRQPVDAASPAAPGRSGEGTPALAEVQCPLCGTAAAEVVHRLPEAALVRCLACGLAFFTPPPPAERLREIYRGAGPSLAAQLAATRGGELPHALLDRIEEHVPRRGRLLDVGCAHGAVLLAARQRGWTVAGFEISAESVGIARGEFGLDVVQGDHLDQAGFPDGAFDVVTMQHVLEHVVDPLRLLRAARRLLRPGGLLWLAVPNFGGFLASTLGARWGWVTYPNHLVYFTPQTLGLALERAGFRVTRLLSQTAGDQVEQARDLLTRMGLAAAGNGSGIDVEQLDRHLRGAEVIAVASVPAVPGPDAAASPPEPAARGAEKHAIRERWVEGPATGWGDLYGHPEVRRVLDFGCGEKGTIPYEQFPRWEFTGLDRFPPRNLQRAFPANARYVQYEGERIPFPDGHFEFVVANFVLEHVRDPRRVLAELTRVLKRYGFLYAAVPNAVSMADAIYRRSVLPEDEGGHEFKYTFKSFLKLAFEMGFRLLGFQEGVEESLAWIAKEKQNTRFDWLACYDYYAREYGINLRADSYYTFMLQQVGVPGFRVYNDFMAQGRQEAQGKRQASNPALSTQHLAPSTPARPPTPDPAQRLAGLVQAGAEHLAAGRPTEAVEAFRAALAIAPDLAEVRGALGSALVNLGRQAEALTELAAAAEALGTSEAWNNLGCAYALAGRAEEARGAFLEAIQRDGANREPQRNLAALFEALGMPREAAAAYDLLLLAAPDNAEALAGKARCAAALQASGAGAPDDLARAIAERAAAGPRLPGLSAHLLVRNEVELIDLYLDNTLPYVDELIVIDGGSTDGTLGRIRARESDKVRLFVWPQDGAQFTAGWREPHRRNACIALTSRQWILKKDVDEFFREADYARIRDLLATPRDTLVCFPRINFWGDVDHVRLSTAEDPHWSPDPQGNLWRADLGLQWNDQPLHCQLAKDGAIYTRTEVCQEVPIYHYHWALGKRVKPNDLRRGDLVADPAALPPEAEDRAVDPATVRWDRAGVRVARFWDRHPETIERHLGRAMATQPERNLQGLAAYFGRPYEAVKQQYWHSAPAVVDE
jgi:SAM-dependent methyltransferase/Flp pilus assembly protein TadD